MPIPFYEVIFEVTFRKKNEKDLHYLFILGKYMQYKQRECSSINARIPSHAVRTCYKVTVSESKET